MGLLVGASVLIGLRILGLAPDLPIAPLKRFYRFIWAGFWIQVASVLLLLTGYPTKSLTNPLFYVELTLIALALTSMHIPWNRVTADANFREAAMMVLR